MSSSPQAVPRTVADRGSGGRAGRSDQEILRRGLETFAELGYQATSVRELAKRLEVSHNYINERYGSKEAFWRAVIDFAMKDGVEDLFRCFEQPDDAAVLRDAVSRFFALAASSPEVNRIIAEESLRDSDRLDYLGQYTRRFWDELIPVIQRLMDSDHMPPAPPQLVCTAINAATMALVCNTSTGTAAALSRLAPAFPNAPEDMQRVADRLAVLVVDGLLPSSSQDSA